MNRKKYGTPALRTYALYREKKRGYDLDRSRAPPLHRSPRPPEQQRLCDISQVYQIFPIIPDIPNFFFLLQKFDFFWISAEKVFGYISSHVLVEQIFKSKIIYLQMVTYNC